MQQIRQYILCTISIAMLFTSCFSNKKLDTTTPNDSANSIYLLVGTYTNGTSEGIYVLHFDTVLGTSTQISSVKTNNPSYLAISTDEKYVYSVAEEDDKTGAVKAFAFDKEQGKLQLLNSQYAGGKAPCYISIDKLGKHVLAANYNGGNISIFETSADGKLEPASKTIQFSGNGIDTLRQAQPHLHYINYSLDNNYVFAADLGTDKIYKFKVNAGDASNYLEIGNPAFYKIADGAGPRHMAFHPNGKYAYLLSELSGNVFAFTYNDGNLTEMQTIQADSLGAGASADIHTSPDGKYLYASNRLKGDGIAIFSIDVNNGKLSKIAYQQTAIHPRNFNITPNGKFLLVACRDSNIIQVFERNKQTGTLRDIHKNIQIDKPVCIKFASL